ncbi:MAG: HD domain-containing protein [Trueperaceae bacterium]|nr:HD domain-containing protein [Trueperaceae bacterium]
MTVTGLEERLALAYAAYRLKDEPRVGWVMHGVAGPESVAAHSWGTAYLCLLFAADAGVDLGRALAIALVHDLAEATTGDFAARAAATDRPVSEAEKARLERDAIADLLPPRQAALHELWRAYEDRADPAARFVRDMNLIDMCLQALLYEREARYDADVQVPSEGGHRHLDEFFLSAEWRLEGEVAKRLFGSVRLEYEKARAQRRTIG